MKISEFHWYATESHAQEEARQAMRRGGRDGDIYAVIEPLNAGIWLAIVNLHLPESMHQRMECDSELEATLAAELWLGELIASGTVA